MSVLFRGAGLVAGFETDLRGDGAPIAVSNGFSIDDSENGRMETNDYARKLRDRQRCFEAALKVRCLAERSRPVDGR